MARAADPAARVATAESPESVARVAEPHLRARMGIREMQATVEPAEPEVWVALAISRQLRD